MITGEKVINVRVAVHAKDITVYHTAIEAIRNDFISVVKHYESENTDDIRVYLRDEPRCSHCGNTYPECSCGRPHQRPAV